MENDGLFGLGGDGSRASMELEVATFHVVPCTLDFMRVPRGRGVGADKQEFCPGFVRKKYVAIEKDVDGNTLGTLPGGYKPKEILELDFKGRGRITEDMQRCMRCGKPDSSHKELRVTDTDLSNAPRYRCKNCSYCDNFCRVNMPENNACEDCGCDASKHQLDINEPIPKPKSAKPTKPKKKAGPSSGAGDLMGRIAAADGGTGSGTAQAANASFAPGQRYEVIGTIMRQGEDLMSPKITRLDAGTGVEVLEVGTGPTGKRIKVNADTGVVGWISVISDAGVELLKPVAPRAKPVDETKEALGAGIIADAIARLGMEEDAPVEAPASHVDNEQDRVPENKSEGETIGDILGKLGMDSTTQSAQEDHFENFLARIEKEAAEQTVPKQSGAKRAPRGSAFQKFVQQ